MSEPSNSAPPVVRARAPGDLAHIQAFVNTLQIVDGHDDLGSPSDLERWLRDAGLAPPDLGTLGESDLRRTIELREALRSLLLVCCGQPADPAAVAVLEREAAATPPRISVGADGLPHLVGAGHGLDDVVSCLLTAMAVAAIDGTWWHLKVCRDPQCRWAFYDSSKNGSGAWCDMKLCGNRAKARRFRERRGSASGTA